MTSQIQAKQLWYYRNTEFLTLSRCPAMARWCIFYNQLQL